jgi:CelD/BcsL family acetyltransferase involved in cellulose biosynthesis
MFSCSAGRQADFSMHSREDFHSPPPDRRSAAPAAPLTSSDARITIETITDERRFLELRSIWNRLVEEAKIDHPFASHEWLQSWWKCFADGNKLHILLIKAGDRPIAIAPLMLSVGRMYGVKVRKIGFIANIHTPRFDFIVADRPRIVYQAIWQHLLKSAKLWDVVELIQVIFDSPTLKELPRFAAKDNFLTGIWHSEDCPYVNFDQGWKALLMGLSHNHRSQMGKRLRRLRRTGPVNLEIVSNQEDLQRLLDEGLGIEAAAWKLRAGSAILCHPALICFYRDVAEAMSKLGILRLIFLKVAGTRIAFAYALFHKNKIYVLKAGYRPEYAAYSPYLLLCHLLFQDACAHGVAEYEFLGGSDAWKLRWADKTKSQYWAYIMPRKLRTTLIHTVKFGALPSLRKRRLYTLVRRQLMVAFAILYTLELCAL